MSTTVTGFKDVMHPDRYVLMPPQKVALIEEYYENKCREKEADIPPAQIESILESLHFFEKAPAAAVPRQLMIGNVPYERITKPPSKSVEADGPKISEEDLFFSKFILQKSYRPSFLSSKKRREGLCFKHDSLEDSRSSKEVWNALTRDRLCWGEHPVSPDDDANHCFQSMIRVENFFLTAFRSPIATALPHLQGTSGLPFTKAPLLDMSFPIRVDIHHPNAFNQVVWDVEGRKVCCGDFDPAIYAHSPAADPDAIVHAFSQAAIYCSSNIDHKRQGGAINESLADVFTIMEKHSQAKVKAGAPDASWNIGEGLITGAHGNSLRSMATPGFGFRDHPILGDDDQVGNMREYQPDHPLDQDHGGVHRYSGIANRAFYLAATQEGGFSWEKIGTIWQRAHESQIRSQSPYPNNKFAQFAIATVLASLEFEEPISAIVQKAWDQVGIRI